MQLRRINAQRPLMSTLIELTVISDLGTIETNNILEETFAVFQSVVNRFTRFNDTSELSILNSNSGQINTVSPELAYLASYALKLSAETNGAYDPTVFDLLETYGYGKNPNFAKLDNPLLLSEIKKILLLRPSYKFIKVDTQSNTIEIRPNQKIDLGSLAKGYAIDLAFDKLSQHFSAFCINAGGDIRVKGRNEEMKPWQIGLQIDKNISPSSQYLELENIALAASGNWARKVKYFHHILDPRTGLPANEIKATFVLAPTAIEADALATAVFILGKEGIALLDKHLCQGIIYETSEIFYKTSGFKL